MPPLDWQKAIARLDDICALVSDATLEALVPSQTNHSFALLDVNLVAENDLLVSVFVPSQRRRQVAHKWEAFWVHGASLDQKLIPPAI